MVSIIIRVLGLLSCMLGRALWVPGVRGHLTNESKGSVIQWISKCGFQISRNCWVRQKVRSGFFHNILLENRNELLANPIHHLGTTMNVRSQVLSQTYWRRNSGGRLGHQCFHKLSGGFWCSRGENHGANLWKHWISLSLTHTHRKPSLWIKKIDIVE